MSCRDVDSEGIAGEPLYLQVFTAPFRLSMDFGSPRLGGVYLEVLIPDLHLSEHVRLFAGKGSHGEH
jgi:hypothetical protein